jgi:ABC-type branched-subunit amino acid transport system ATPase component
MSASTHPDARANATAATPALEARDVTVRYGGVVALDGVSLAVPPGAIVGLIGPNGAGKTTLFGVCSGLIRPARGRVLIDGRDVTRSSTQERARFGLARTFQRPEIFYTLTVREHLELAYIARHERHRVVTDMLLAPSRWRRDPAAAQRVDGLLDSLSLRAVEHRRAAGLPLGLLRSLEVGRALASAPQIVLLDEPSSGLDVRETEQLGAVLQTAVREEGFALLLVEHDLDLVLGLSEHVYVLDFGKQIADGSPSEIRRSQAVQSAYLGVELGGAPDAGDAP